MAYQRDTLEFGRAAYFSDAVFAIALTLLIVTVAIPAINNTSSASDLLVALKALIPRFFGFFLGFTLMANYWAAHHRFWSRLERVDARLITINLAYLSFIAFLPFATGLYGTYTRNPVAASFFAVNLAAVSGIEVVQIWYARHAGLPSKATSAAVFRYDLVTASVPVVMLLLSIPVAFVSTWLAPVAWLVIYPVEAVLSRRAPAGAQT